MIFPIIQVSRVHSVHVRKDGGTGLQMWRTEVNVLNRQSLTTDKGRPSTSGEEENPKRKTSTYLEMLPKLFMAYQ